MYWVLMVLNTDDGVVRLQAQYRDVTIHWASNQDVWCKKTSINEPSWCALHLQVSTSSWVEIVVFQNKPWSTIDSMHYCKLIYIKKKKREREITAIFTLLYFSCKLSCWEKLLFRFFFHFMASFVCYEALQRKILVPRWNHIKLLPFLLIWPQDWREDYLGFQSVHANTQKTLLTI